MSTDEALVSHCVPFITPVLEFQQHCAVVSEGCPPETFITA